MKILGLDISTKTGYAVIEDGRLIDYGLVKPAKPHTNDEFYLPDFVALFHARLIAEHLLELIIKFNPDAIYVEQTNGSRNRTTQKVLEFIHCCFLAIICDERSSVIPDVNYIDTSQWRSAINLALTKDQRKHNKEVKQKTKRGKITPKHLVVDWANRTYNLSFKKKDHDVADGIALAHVGYIKSIQPQPVKVSIESIISE